jgi:hypothetical protein
VACTRVRNLQPHARVYYQSRVHMRFPAGAQGTLPVIDGGSNHDAGMRLATVRHYRADVPIWGVVGCYLVIAAAIVAWQRRRWRRLAGAGDRMV